MAGQVDAHRIVASFTGSHRFVLDYLLEEAFQRQPPEVRDFLLHTAILERLCGPLCDAVLRIGESANQQIGKSANREPTDSPFADSQAVLEYLDRANLFIIPLDPERGWYRYHHLFAELLRHRLQTTAGEQAGLLHRRASAWYAAHGFPAEAVQHALAGQDWAQAATLIQDSSDALLKRGEVVTVLGWLRALPDDWVRSRPQFCLTCSWALILTGQLDIAEVYLGQAEETSQNDPAFLRDILSLQASIARARGDNRRTIEIAERTLALVPPDAFAERGVAALNLGLAQWNRGDLAGAEQALVEAERAAHQAGVDYPRLIALTFLGIIQASWGKLRQAAALFERTIQSAGDSPAGALAHLELAALLYEWNELGAAADHLQRGLELSQRGGNVEVEIGGLRTLARLRQAQGDAAAALEMLERVHQFTRDHYLAPIMRARDAACHVQIALTQNDLSAAIRWAEQMTEDADSNPFYPLLGLTAARLLLAQNQKAAAAQKLMELYEIAERAGWSYGALATRVWQALAAETAETALGFLTDALKRGQPEHFIRTFADAGQASVPLLQEAARRGVTPEYVGQLLAAIGAQSGPAADRAPGLIEPLSERELEVLRLLAAGLSNRAIAAKLILSEGTVKTHIHNLSGKLAAANRTEAAARARELRLI
jgi:LuxR family maltose regulon positive regulatory protein